MQRRKKLPKELLTKIPAWLAEGDLNEVLSDGVTKRAYIAHITWLKYRLLLSHYGLSKEDPHQAAFKVAIKLAQDYVPGFQVGRARGRPRKSLRGYIGLLSPSPRQSGRPKKWTVEKYETLLEARWLGAESLQDKSLGKKVTDQLALEEFIRLSKPNWRSDRVRSRAKQLAKRLSEAKKTPRKSEEK